MVLLSDARPPDSSLRLEVVGPGSRAAWTEDGIGRTESGFYTVLLPIEILAPGEWRARILVSDPRPGEILEEFRFRVAASDEKR